MNALAKYDAARAALAEAKSVDEVLGVRDEAERLKLYARQAKDRDLVADAMEIQMRAERRLGEMIRTAKEAGQIGAGRPRKAEENPSEPEAFSRVTLADAGIDHKLSMKAQRLAEVSNEQFAATIARAREKIVSGSAIVVDPIKDLTTAEKQQKRANKEVLLGAYQRSFPDKLYGVIYDDNAWRFEPRSRLTGMDRAPENHYPTMTLEEIIALPIGSIAAKDCVRFSWATIPMLPQALAVMAAHGFEYKSHLVWVKDKIGPGYWVREKHELLLIGTRGSIPCPAPGTQHESALILPRGRHSEKPEFFLEMIETWYPSLPKIELNRRGPARPGWDAWGNEAVETQEGEAA